MKTYAGVMTVFAIAGLVWITFLGPGNDQGEWAAATVLVEDESGRLVTAPNTNTAAKRQPTAFNSQTGQYALIERSGEILDSRELKGTPYVAGFFFSLCPTVCVQQNTKMQEEFFGENVRFLSISCDPEIDQPQVLQAYAKKFDADPQQWLFLTGKMKTISEIGEQQFHLGVERRGHPERFALVDAQGSLQGVYSWTDESQWQTLRMTLRNMLESGGTLPEKSTAGEGARAPDEAANGTHEPAGSAEPAEEKQ